MPRKVRPTPKAYISDFTEGIDEEENAAEEKTVLSSSKKRPKDFAKPQDSDDEQEEDQPVTSMLQQFGAEVKKTISSKRRKLENFTKQCNASRAKVDLVLDEQKKSRSILYDEFKKQIGTLLSQWESDIERLKEGEEKLNSLWNQQMKLLTQTRVVQSQRYKSMKLLHEQYSKSVGEMEASNETQHKNVTEDLNKELANLQRKFLMESRNQEMANMRKSLHSMLYQ